MKTDIFFFNQYTVGSEVVQEAVVFPDPRAMTGGA